MTDYHDKRDTDRKLLLESIDHWKENVQFGFDALAKGISPYDCGARRDSTACALCEEYIDNEPACTDCPVSNATAFPMCERTPWTETMYIQSGKPWNVEDFIRHTTKEVNFLTYLLCLNEKDL